jgi:hypothetical protein
LSFIPQRGEAHQTRWCLGGVSHYPMCLRLSKWFIRPQELRTRQMKIATLLDVTLTARQLHMQSLAFLKQTFWCWPAKTWGDSS